MRARQRHKAGGEIDVEVVKEEEGTRMATVREFVGEERGGGRMVSGI